MFGFLVGSPLTLLIVGLIGVLLFGNRLPEVMKNLGRGVSEFKKGIDTINSPIEEIKRLK